MGIKDFTKRIADKTEQFIEEYETKRGLLESPDELLNLQWQEQTEHAPHGSRYVIDENCLIVSPTLATVFDIEKAIIIQQIHYFVCINRQRKEADCFKKQNHFWMYCTPAKWREMLPFISPSSLKRKLKELAKAGVVVRSNSHADEYITYYRINYSVLVKQINDFEPEEQSFKLQSLRHILRPVRFDKTTAAIVEHS